MTPAERLEIFKQANKLKDYQVRRLVAAQPAPPDRPVISNRPDGFIPDGEVLRLPWDQRPE